MGSSVYEKKRCNDYMESTVHGRNWLYDEPGTRFWKGVTDGRANRGTDPLVGMPGRFSKCHVMNDRIDNLVASIIDATQILRKKEYCNLCRWAAKVVLYRFRSLGGASSRAWSSSDLRKTCAIVSLFKKIILACSTSAVNIFFLKKIQ